jgi:hypothetical protein
MIDVLGPLGRRRLTPRQTVHATADSLAGRSMRTRLVTTHPSAAPKGFKELVQPT